MNTYVIGVDGCRAGWIGARYDPSGSKLTYAAHPDFSSLLLSYADTASIAVDIPIGLTESFQPRSCDPLARRLIGPRSNSVFPAPDRRLLQFSNYWEASGFSRDRCGKGLTRQSFAIFPKIAQADSVISPELQSRVFEIHPELCFWAAAGRRHLIHPKRTPDGFEERQAILEQALPGAVIPTLTQAAGLLSGAGPDDVLDATVAAWTAWRHARGICERIPEVPELDVRGLRMEMVY